MITVLGATGNTGGRIVETLREAGEPVRAVGRDPGRLAPSAALGAQPCVGDAADPEFLRHALDGADAAYVLMPIDVMEPGYATRQRAIGESIVTALRATCVPHVVALSSLGAEVDGGPDLARTGFLGSLYEQEQRLATLDAHVTLLRPGLFFESFLPALDAMRAYRTHADSIDPDRTLPMVATRDVAAVGAGALLARDWSGTVVREVLGAADRTVPDAIAALGPALGMPELSYVRVPDEEMAGMLRDAGLPDDVARLQVAMNRAFNDGTVGSTVGRTPESTTPTTVEAWARTLAGAEALR